MVEEQEGMSRYAPASLQHAEKKGCPVANFLGKTNGRREHPPHKHQQMWCSVHITCQREMRTHGVSG